jgi:hypothetical protein
MKPSGRRRTFARLVLACLVLTAGSAPGAAQQIAPPAAPRASAIYSEAEVKAAFLYRFGTYVQWPADPSGEDRPLTIAVLGAPRVASQLEALLPGRKIQGRALQARRLARIQDVGDAAIVYIGAEYNGRLAEILSATAGRPMLVVTDAPDGLDRGAMVNFQVVDERVRFEISLVRAQDAGLSLSSRLLSAALRVVTSSCCSGLHALRLWA